MGIVSTPAAVSDPAGGGDSRHNPAMTSERPAPRTAASGDDSIGPLRVLARGDGWLVLEKPPGLHSVMLPGERGGESVEALLRGADSTLAALPQCGLVQRLDFETSGGLLVATDVDARARLLAAVRCGAVRKGYAIATDRPLAAAGEFRRFFSSRHRGSAKVTVRSEGEPRHEGRCVWRCAAERTIGGAPRLEAEVELVGPGRRHQIRAGFASLGAPLLGDPLYGGTPAERLHLHAAWLVVDGVRVESRRPW